MHTYAVQYHDKTGWYQTMRGTREHIHFLTGIPLDLLVEGISNVNYGNWVVWYED